jgi:hypothetical protein
LFMFLPFSSKYMQSSAKYFFQGVWSPGSDGIEELLGAADKFVLRDAVFPPAGRQAQQR